MNINLSTAYKKDAYRFKVGQLVRLDSAWPDVAGFYGLITAIDKTNRPDADIHIQFFLPEGHMWNTKSRYRSYVCGWWPRADYIIIVDELS